MDILFWILGGYILLLTHLWFHELGHYTVGRFLVGIPKENIQIRLFQYPAHVALRDQDKNWIKPNDEEGNFVRTYFTYDPDGKRSFCSLWAGSFYNHLFFFVLLLPFTIFLIMPRSLILSLEDHLFLISFIFLGI